MDEALLRTVRLERTLAELAALESGIGKWLGERVKADTDVTGHYVGRHKTQLEALDSFLKVAAAALSRGAGEVVSGPGAALGFGAFCDSCRDYDEAAVWLRRLWGFFRDKFDQRTDEVDGVLKAADEIVWSCYHHVMERAHSRRAAVAHGPAPLPFLAPEYSPAAIESDRPLPPGLTLSVEPPGWDPEVDALVKTLPMGLLRLPPWCVTAPWWLVYAAHEVGHHVQNDLDLHEHVRAGIVAAVTAREPVLAPRWSAWANEIFADFFSVLMVGPWAAWSVLEVERSTTERMVQPRSAYPPPLVRVALLVSAAQALDVAGSWVPTGFDVGTLTTTYAALGSHLRVVDAVIASLRAELPGGLGTLETLCGFDAADFKKSVTFWKTRLAQEDVPSTAPTIHTGRYVAAASIARYADIITNVDAATRAEKLRGLAGITLKALHASAAPGTRGEGVPPGDAPARGEALAERLTAWSRQRRQQADQGES
jgi:hypothetical protein